MMPEREPPEPIRKIIEAMTTRAVARCHEQGIPLADFYAAMRAEKAAHPGGTLTELFERTFQRLGARGN